MFSEIGKVLIRNIEHLAVAHEREFRPTFGARQGAIMRIHGFRTRRHDAVIGFAHAVGDLSGPRLLRCAAKLCKANAESASMIFMVNPFYIFIFGSIFGVALPVAAAVGDEVAPHFTASA